MENFFKWMSKPIPNDEVVVWFSVHNMIPERIELYGDIFKSLYQIISETYLGEESSETKISMSDDDKINHFEWCWKTLLDNFAKENIRIKHGGKHKDYFQEFLDKSKRYGMSNITLVTGLWNIGRENLEEGWSRSFSHYLEKFEQLLKVEENLIIFGEEELEKFVWERREQSNTQFIRRDKSWFIKNDFYDKIQKIRINPDWYNQSSWLKESTQGRLEN